MMASGCAATPSSFLLVKSAGAHVLSRRSSNRVSSSQCQFFNLAASREGAVTCCTRSSSSGCTNFRDVRSGRRRGSHTLPQRNEGLRICNSVLAAGIISPLQCFDGFCVASSPSAGALKRQINCGLGSHFGLETAGRRQTRNSVWERQERKQRLGRRKAKDDDFEIDDDGGFDAMELADLDDDEEEDFRDYETEYESPTGETRGIMQRESDTFINTEGEVEETVVSWKINEDEFHKINLQTCDFFIRKVPDPDDDVYDFREMYVTPPDTDIYSIPKVNGDILPKKPVRCTLSNYEVIHTTEPPVDEPRAPLAKTEFEVMKVFLTKHYKDRREKHEKFILDFEEIYVIDAVTKSFYRADVKVDVPGGKNRDRSLEVLTVRDQGTSFRIILEVDQKSPDEIVQALHWERTHEKMENYLRGFRDYEVSNWF